MGLLAALTANAEVIHTDGAWKVYADMESLNNAGFSALTKSTSNNVITMAVVYTSHLDCVPMIDFSLTLPNYDKTGKENGVAEVKNAINIKVDKNTPYIFKNAYYYYDDWGFSLSIKHDGDLLQQVFEGNNVTVTVGTTVSKFSLRGSRKTNVLAFGQCSDIIGKKSDNDYFPK